MSEHDLVRVLASRTDALRLSRRGFLGGALGVAGTMALSACGGDSGGSGGGGGGGGGNELNMYTWAEYNDPDVLDEFTSKEGPSIQLDAYGSNEEMIAKLVAANGTSGYDIVVPTGTYIPQMSQNGLLQELDTSRLKNFENIQAEFRDQAWDPGNKYSVCKSWGTTGYAYDTTKIQRELTSWADFVDCAQKEAAGTTSVLEDPREVLGLAQYALGIDTNTTDEKELDRAEELLLTKLAPNISTFDSYPSAAMAEGSSSLVMAWNGDARQGILAGGGDKWKWVFPSEGANIWMDNYTIVEGAKNVDAAYAFIDYVLQPDIALRELSYIGYHTGVQGIQEAAEKEGLERLDLVFLTPEQLAKLTSMEVNEAQQRVTAIMDALRAKAGA